MALHSIIPPIILDQHMFDALHPSKPELISYNDYLVFALSLSCSRPNDAPPARCPVCRKALKVRAGKTKNDGHFYHHENLYCPTKDPSGRPYLKLASTLQDAKVVQENRKFAHDNIELIYTRIKSMVPHLNFPEFIELLKEAKRINVYGYANLIPEYLPYVYVMLINFLPSKSCNKQRKLKFCFFYEDGIESFEELWFNKGFSSNLFRISFSASTVQKVVQIETSIDYLRESTKALSEKQKDWCYSAM